MDGWNLGGLILTLFLTVTIGRGHVTSHGDLDIGQRLATLVAQYSVRTELMRSLHAEIRNKIM